MHVARSRNPRAPLRVRAAAGIQILGAVGGNG
jgi:hypothetical protein